MIYFFVYLFLEVLFFVQISSIIGGLATFLEIVFSAFLGFAILIKLKTTLMQNIGLVLSGQVGMRDFRAPSIFSVIGAFLLIAPGFLTDIVGIALQFSLFSSIIVSRMDIKYKKNSSEFKNYTQKDSDVIDVEVISDNRYIK